MQNGDFDKIDIACNTEFEADKEVKFYTSLGYEKIEDDDRNNKDNVKVYLKFHRSHADFKDIDEVKRCERRYFRSRRIRRQYERGYLPKILISLAIVAAALFVAGLFATNHDTAMAVIAILFYATLGCIALTLFAWLAAYLKERADLSKAKKTVKENKLTLFEDE